MHALNKRLTYLRDREALAAFLLPAVIVYTWHDSGGEISWGIRIGALFLLSYMVLAPQAARFRQRQAAAQVFPSTVPRLLVVQPGRDGRLARGPALLQRTFLVLV